MPDVDGGAGGEVTNPEARHLPRLIGQRLVVQHPAKPNQRINAYAKVPKNDTRRLSVTSRAQFFGPSFFYNGGGFFSVKRHVYLYEDAHLL